MKVFILGLMGVQLAMLVVGFADLVIGNTFDGCMSVGLNTIGLTINLYAFGKV